MTWTIPNTLTAGAPENVNDVTTNFNSLAADTEFAYSTYKTILERAYAPSSATAMTILLGMDGYTGGNPANALIGGNVVYLDPADYAVTGRTTKYRIRASLMTNATAPAINFTAGLYPISAVAGGAGSVTATLGTVTSGSTVVFTAQAASTRGQGNSGDFTAPAAGYYGIGLLYSGTQAANSKALIDVALQVRQV